MFKSKFPYRLYLVVSEADCKLNFFHVVEEAIIGGVDMVQLREKHLNESAYIAKALQLKAITDRYNVPLIINDNLMVAKAVNAFGIHVGHNDPAPMVIQEAWAACRSIGYSIECLQQLQTQETATANWLAISPVFKTSTKKDTITEWGLDGIRAIRSLTDKPLIAIGGINEHKVGQVMNAGADCIAVVSAICASGNPRQAAENLKNEIIKYDDKI